MYWMEGMPSPRLIYMRAMKNLPFDLDRFIADCRDSLGDSRPQQAMREVLRRALAEPSGIKTVLGEPNRAQIQRLHVAPDLVILNLIWAPGMSFIPHDHRMWAIIGIYEGREDNVFWRRVPDGTSDDAGAKSSGHIESAGARTLVKGDCETLGRDIIHSVTNPTGKFTCALHIYGGDFFNTPRSEWDEKTLEERPYSVANAARAFEHANDLMAVVTGPL